MTEHGFSDARVNRFFKKKSKFREQIDTVLKAIDVENTRVAECMKRQQEQIRKRHPEWKDDMVIKKAQTSCGQKPSVPTKNAYLEKYDEELEECISRKISIIKKEHPEWEQKQLVEAAHSYCMEGQKDSQELDAENIIQSFNFIKKNITNEIDFMEYAAIMGYNVIIEDKSICYKMENLRETADEYIVPVILATAMVQDYPAKGIVMAKRPEDLAKTLIVDYITGEFINKAPTFEFHPEKEKREDENGFTLDVKYQDERERLVGELRVQKKKLSDNLRGYFERGEMIHVSIGFMYTEGPGGVFKGSDDNRWNGHTYDVAQRNILITHLALLPPNVSRGRCPLPYCGVGININDSVPLENLLDIKIETDHIITDADGIIDVGRDLFVRSKTETINITDTLRSQNSEIKELKKTLRKYFIQIAQALNR